MFLNGYLLAGIVDASWNFPLVICVCCQGSISSSFRSCTWLVIFFNPHDDVIKWKHFPRNRPFVRGIHRSPVKSPHKGQWHGAFMFSLICAWINRWVSNREAGDLRRYRAHYDVIVMIPGDVSGCLLISNGGKELYSIRHIIYIMTHPPINSSLTTRRLRFLHMMTSSNGSITGPLYEEFTGRRWIPLTKASDAELWCFLWSALMFSLIYAWTNGWVNNRDPGDLKCHRTYYDVTVMNFAQGLHDDILSIT